jgi:dipeptide/tripeptide permease
MPTDEGRTMDEEPQEPIRLFPQGVVTLTVVGMLERFGFYAGVATLFFFLEEKLWTDFETAGTLYEGMYLSAALLPVLGGMIGDFMGHRRSLILGAALSAGALVMLAFPIEGDDAGTWLVVLLALLALASGRAIFPVSTVTLIGHLYDSREHRVPSAGAFTLLHVMANVAALFAPMLAFHLGEFFESAWDLNRFESTCVVLVLAGQPVVAALILVASRRRLFAAAESAVREKVYIADDSPPPDGLSRYAPTMLPLLLVGLFIFSLAYQGASPAQSIFLHRALEMEGSFGVELLMKLNPLVIVLVGPVAVIVYGVMRARGRAVPAALLAALGMGATGVGLLLMLPVVGAAPVDDFAPFWSEDAPSLFWPGASITIVALAEILTFGLVPALVTSASPRRFRGLIYGAAFAVGGLASLVLKPFEPYLHDEMHWGVFTTLGAVALLGAVVAFIGGMIAPKRGR